jgi:TonB family protein
LRLFITVKGAVLPESTRIVEGSGQAALDSAALAGSEQLRFRPARKNGVPVPVSILFPVYYRHPDGPPFP